MSKAHLNVVPVRSREAKDFVRAWHRHHPPPAGQIFAVGAADEMGTLRAVAIVGWPVARHLDDGTTLEVTRTASDGTPNANSRLYGTSWRAAKALGYRRLITFTQEGESGASLRGAGWHLIASRPPGPAGTPPPAPARATATTTSPASCGKPPDPPAWRRPAHLRTPRPRRHVPAPGRGRRDRGHPRPPHHRRRHRPVQRHAARRPALPPRRPHGRQHRVPARPQQRRPPTRREARRERRPPRKAIAHYTQALAPLLVLTTTAQETLQQKLDSLDHHSLLRIHLDDGGRALVAARTALDAPRPPATSRAPAPAPLRVTATRRRV